MSIKIQTMGLDVKAPTTVVRGCTIIFRALFSDFDGNTVAPVSAALTVKYPLRDGFVETDPIAMAKEADSEYWSAFWQSADSSRGHVEWSVVATDGTRPARKDGRILLTANGANPEPE